MGVGIGKRFIAVVLAGILALSFSACSQKADYDVSAYIKGVLDSSYKNAETAGGDSDYNGTTTYNAAVRFFDKYAMNASEEQKSAMQAVFKRAYANSRYTVGAKTEASYGYDVVVTYDVQTTLQNLEQDIRNRRDEAAKEGKALDVGAEYIDKVVALCENSVDAANYDGTGTLSFDIRIDENNDLLLNVNLFDTLDQLILPV